MNKEFTVKDWIDALDEQAEFAVPDDVKNQIKELGTALHRLCAEHDVPCVVGFCSRMNKNTVGMEHIYHLYPLEKVPLELLVMSMLAKAGTKDACEMGLDIIKYLNGEPFDDQ